MAKESVIRSGEVNAACKLLHPFAEPRPVRRSKSFEFHAAHRAVCKCGLQQHIMR